MQKELADLARQHPGHVKLMLCFVRKDDSVVFIEAGFDVNPDSEFIDGVLRILGRNSFKVKVIPPVRPAPKRWKKPENGEENKQESK